MKKRSMILALASMLGISAAATAVSGFAWFTAQTTANIVGGNYQVGAATGNLTLTAVAASDVNCTSTLTAATNTMTIVPTASSVFADESSVDGENFYKLYNVNTETGHEAADVKTEGNIKTTPASKKWMSEVNTKQMVAVSWEMKVANSSEDPTMDVYLTNDGDLFTDAETETHTESSYVNAYRLAIFNDGDLVYFYSKTANGITASDVSSDKYASFSTKGWDGTGLTIDHATTASVINSKSDTASTDAESTLNSQLLINDLDDEAVTLKFVVWCEGCDTPELTVETANKVSLAFSLIGLVD